MEGRCWGGNCLERQKNGKNGNSCSCIIRPDLFNTVIYALNTNYTNTPYVTSLITSVDMLIRDYVDASVFYT
jgi:hypothetical protein